MRYAGSKTPETTFDHDINLCFSSSSGDRCNLEDKLGTLILTSACEGSHESDRHPLDLCSLFGRLELEILDQLYDYRQRLDDPVELTAQAGGAQYNGGRHSRETPAGNRVGTQASAQVRRGNRMRGTRMHLPDTASRTRRKRHPARA